MKFYDLFGGIGGFRLGLQRASDDFKCVGYLDNDKYAVKSYNEIFGEEHEPRDAREIQPEEPPDFDILCGGFPCQSFSIAGDRKGLEDTRGSLFFEIARIARDKKPEMLFLENVKGLLSAKAVTEEGEPIEGTKGYVFHKILETLHELGYFVEWQVLNSKHFGVPQNRERVFIIGHLGGEPRRKVFPLGREDAGDSGQDGGERGMTAKGYDTNMSQPDIGEAERVYGNKGVIPPIKSDGKLIKGERGMKVINNQLRPEDRPSIQEGQSGGSGILFNDEYSYALSSSPHYVKPVMTPDFTEKNQNMKSQIGSSDGSMFTVDGTSIHGVMEFDRKDGIGKKLDVVPTVNKSEWRGLNRNQRQACVLKPNARIRKLTPRECWRLQGFPDWAFEKAREVNSDTQLYKQAGNAVTVNVIEAIGKKIHDIRINLNGGDKQNA